MKIEIKFRGKRIDTDEWIIGNLFIPEKLVRGMLICSETTYGDFMPGFEDGDNPDEFLHKGIALGNFHEVIPDSVGQFTGLLDKNGKEIYEGDIVKCDELIMIVDFVQSSFCKCNESGNWIIHSHDNIEVIGNLYENYELINPKS